MIEETVAVSRLALATRRDVVVRSLKIAAVVGTILVLINYWDKMLAGSLTATDLMKMALTYCVPYCVATYSAVSALAQGARGNS